MKTKAEFIAALLRYFGLNEALRSDDSNEELRRQLEQALNEWPGRPGNSIHVMFTFSDRLIAYSWIETERDIQRGAWEIPYQRSDAGFTFGQPVAVKEVRLFEPLGESTGQRQRLTETIEQRLTVVESQDGPRRIKATGITADVVNGNKRRYPRAVLAAAISELNSHLHESNGQGLLVATGEIEHPSDKGGRPNLLETVVAWNAASLDSTGKVRLEGAIVDTSKGRDISALINAGVRVGVSMRGVGMFESIKESGQTIQQVTELQIKGFDLVAQPSDPNGAVTESQQQEPEKRKIMTLDELLKLLKEKPEMLEALQKQLGLSDPKAIAESLGVEDIGKAKTALEEAAKAKAELEERKRQEAIASAITEATKDLKYGDEMNKLFVEAVRAAKPESAEAVKSLVETKRKEYDQMMSTAKLAGMGKEKPKGAIIDKTSEAFEESTGLPKFARAAWEINESLVKAGEGHRRDVRKGESPAEIFAARALARFDQLHQAKLVQESRMFEEAEQTSDLNLPYSVARMLIEQAYPELVAANVYDFGSTDTSPTRIYYEAYAGESGAAPTITDETVTSDEGAWVDLDYKRLRPSTVVVTGSGGTPTYAEGTDYVIDYEDGKLWTITGGSIGDATALKVDYVYDAYRKGEMAAIERAKNTLTYTTLEMAADRLAMEISNEAIVFSRSQMNYDAVTRTLGNLARLIRRKIDKDILYKGLAASLRQANNSGGTWASASDPVVQLVEKIGIARVKVYNRNYVPTSILASASNADRLSNWDGFTQLGFPNATLSAAGFAGGVKGLPIFTSTEFTDAYIQVVHRELVMHRVYQPMMFKGPFPSYSNGQLVGADQYYAEEFNGSLVPVIEKTAHVVIS